jgi:hypothetical protein
MVYLDFVAERHLVWERRQSAVPPPWTQDPILARKKFTNVFRVLDYGTQFFINDLAHPNLPLPEQVFRAILYRYTNLPSAWDWYKSATGAYPRMRDHYSGELYRLWDGYHERGGALFSRAYRFGYVPSGASRLDLIRKALRDVEPLVDKLLLATTTEEIVKTLPQYLTNHCGPFLSMQIATDINYTELGHAGSEDEYIVAGPGAAAGLQLVFPGAEDSELPELLRIVTEDWLPEYPGVPQLELPRGKVRQASLMDTQNTFCEFFKYHRELGRPDKGKSFQPQHPGAQPRPVYPPHWSRS